MFNVSVDYTSCILISLCARYPSRIKLIRYTVYIYPIRSCSWLLNLVTCYQQITKSVLFISKKIIINKLQVNACLVYFCSWNCVRDRLGVRKQKATHLASKDTQTYFPLSTASISKIPLSPNMYFARLLCFMVYYRNIHIYLFGFKFNFQYARLSSGAQAFVYLNKSSFIFRGFDFF